MPRKLTAKDFVHGEWNFTDMSADDLDTLLSQISPAYEPAEFSLFGKRKRAYQLCKRHDINGPSDVEAYIEKQNQKKLEDIPAEFQALDREELEELHRRADMRTDFDKYDDPSDNWKLAKALHRKCKSQKWTLEQVRVREPERGSGRGLPIEFDANADIPTIAPNGISEAAADVLNLLRANYEKVTVGRNVSKTPQAHAIIHDLDDLRISLALPKEYANSDGKSS